MNRETTRGKTEVVPSLPAVFVNKFKKNRGPGSLAFSTNVFHFPLLLLVFHVFDSSDFFQAHPGVVCHAKTAAAKLTGSCLLLKICSSVLLHLLFFAGCGS